MNISTNTSFEKYKKQGVNKGYGSVLNSVVSVDPLTPVYISDPEHLPTNALAAYKKGAP